MHGSNLKKVESFVRDDSERATCVTVPVTVSVSDEEPDLGACIPLLGRTAVGPLLAVRSDEVSGRVDSPSSAESECALSDSDSSDSEPDGTPIRPPTAVSRYGRPVRRPQPYSPG